MVEVRALGYTYAGRDVRAMDGIDFDIARGEIYGFLGPNGAGKSTTQNILTGLLRGYFGQAMVWGKEMRSWNGEYYERIGVCFERPNFYRKLTARENLEFFGSLYSGSQWDVGELLDRVGLGAEADVRVGQLSKGMQVRLTFARALLNRPQLLFLDEPTAGLDPVSAANIRNIIRQQQQDGCTVFLTTHNMMVADELCDRVAFIVDGRIALIESPRTLKIEHGQKSLRVEYRNGDGLLTEKFPLQGLGGNEVFLNFLRTRQIETLHTQEEWARPRNQEKYYRAVSVLIDKIGNTLLADFGNRLQGQERELFLRALKTLAWQESKWQHYVRYKDWFFVIVSGGSYNKLDDWGITQIARSSFDPDVLLNQNFFESRGYCSISSSLYYGFMEYYFCYLEARENSDNGASLFNKIVGAYNRYCSGYSSSCFELAEDDEAYRNYQIRALGGFKDKFIAKPWEDLMNLEIESAPYR